MLSLKKTCLQTLSRAAKAGNTAVLGPQLFIPEIYAHYMRQIEIDADDGSERCYFTTEMDFYLLYEAYTCVANYLNIKCNDKFVEVMNNARIDNILEYSYEHTPLFPLTSELYDKYNIDVLIKGKNARCIEEYSIADHRYKILDNIGIFVYDLPPLLIILGLLFRRLIGPKYIDRWYIKHAKIYMFGAS
jgi:hypothetical protein